ncbi:FAD-dependent oxidoreductase [Halalkalibacter nanhaiisediminis]|uniref:2-polyprenyl-6-methoxyphenol hydroxylase-like FAD-dependent oxidoreductase n=1 Tax=Halalkalibacter nanhaiisediminis TaxID=688079 RepID=A0A562QR43_9BACI|nr:NAD(P)/FAD-dependent oxidoreductase [Halalkalibacter nanhaiisediminis]TWI59221.1 2-polyprenyl-6-methoxyphenol hydroxylase-like FAD-dependent oxidoreductase [Halalkalibacter nanhaiisediminis]
MKVEVLIIGGGVAGLSLALKLVKQSISVMVVERDSGFGHIYKGELLQPKTLMIFNQLGLAPVLKPEVNPLQEIITKELNDKNEEMLNVVMSYRKLPTLFQSAAMIPHNRLKELLLKEAIAYDCFHLMQPATFLELKSNHQAIVKKEEETVVISANIIVGADGRGSKIRKSKNVSLKTQKYQHDFLTFSFPSPPNLNHGEMIADETRFLGLFPLPNQRVRTVLLIRPGEYKQFKQEGLQTVYDHYIRLQPKLDGYVQQVKKWKEIQLMMPIRHTVNRYFVDNIIIIGDAAHSVHPMAGEGMNLAIQDADILGELISWMYETNQATEYSLFQWFESVRKERVNYLSWLSHMSAYMYGIQGKGWQQLRVAAIKKLVETELLHVKHMLNISGAGLWPFQALDGLKALTSGKRTLHQKEIERHIFSTSSDYPWQIDK